MASSLHSGSEGANRLLESNPSQTNHEGPAVHPNRTHPGSENKAGRPQKWHGQAAPQAQEATPTYILSPLVPGKLGEFIIYSQPCFPAHGLPSPLYKHPVCFSEPQNTLVMAHCIFLLPSGPEHPLDTHEGPWRRAGLLDIRNARPLIQTPAPDKAS